MIETAESGQFRAPRWPVFVAAVFVAGILLFGTVVGLIADSMWFGELGLGRVFWTMLLSKVALGIVGASLFWLTVYANLKWARTRSGKSKFLTQLGSDNPLYALQEMAPFFQMVVTGGSLVVAYLVGVWSAAKWEVALKFIYGVPFEVADPLFGKDIAFHAFQVPFYKYAFALLFFCLLVSIIAVIMVYFFQGHLGASEAGFWISSGARSHLVFLAGCLVLLAGFRFHIAIFDLVVKQRSVAPGAGFADVHAYMGFLNVLRYLSVIAAGVIWAAVWYPHRRLGMTGLGVVAGFFLLAIGYRSAVQHFRVNPNELAMETPFIRRAIDCTRQGYNLAAVQDKTFAAAENLDLGKIRRNGATIQNIRLWEHGPLLTTYGQLQEIRTYYQFLDVDNDRYVIEGGYRQVMLSPRELLPKNLPSRNWINEHLTYTHGYGLCLGPVNRISEEGLPEFFIKDIPPRTSGGIKITRPEIYYGESNGTYAIVRTGSKEFDYPSGSENVYTRYEGTGGVPVSGFLRKLEFALYFRELKIFFTGDIGPDSRILFNRRIQERLAKAAPFIRFDRDPYMVISEEGRIFWIVDGYTSMDRYPYSARLEGVGNYIRNSVKAVVDAYNGTLRFYVSDPADPLIKTFCRIFPGMFTDIGEMPKDIFAHIRYPQTLFSIQAQVYATYHMTDPQVFYNKEDLWAVPRTSKGRGQALMDPYYTIMKLVSLDERDAASPRVSGDAGRTVSREEFILMIPFTPANKKNMIAWMAARCDAPNYGKLLVYNCPKQKLVYGPEQIDNRIDQDAEISEQLTLWDQTGSRVIRGSLLVIPVEDSLLYVQPLYLEATGGGLPELRRVIVAYSNRIAMEPDLDTSLARIFGGGAGAGGAPRKRSAIMAESVSDMVAKAAQALRDGNKALEKRDWQAYGRAMADLERILGEMSARTRKAPTSN